MDIYTHTWKHTCAHIHHPLPSLAKFTCFLKLAKELSTFQNIYRILLFIRLHFQKKEVQYKEAVFADLLEKNAGVLPLVSLVALNGELNIFKVSRDHPLKKEITEICILNYSAVPAGSLLVPLMPKLSFAQVIQKGPFSFPKVAKFIS